MKTFNRMTIVSACNVIGEFLSHDDLYNLEVEWNLVGRCGDSTKSRRTADLANIALTENIEVLTLNGRAQLARALIDKALEYGWASEAKQSDNWKKLNYSLKLDGYEIEKTEKPNAFPWSGAPNNYIFSLRKMLPEQIPHTNIREDENEIIALLDGHGMSKAKNLLTQAIDNFTSGNWAASNGQIRSFYEECFDVFATYLGYTGKKGAKSWDFLGKDIEPPFLLTDIREWGEDRNQDYLVKAIYNRFSMEGSHPNLSSEDNCTYNLQLVLISMRMFLRRFDQRIKNVRK